jgi:hypothetical protein
MQMPQRRLSPAPRARRHGPSCRGGVSSMLRLIAPVSPMAALVGGLRQSALPATPRLVPEADDFAPSRWLVGH